MQKQEAAVGLRNAAASEEERRAAAALMGSVRTPRKAAASAANGFKPGNDLGRKRLPLSEIECDCSAGLSLVGHHWNCPRGRAIKRREKAGEALEL